MIKLKKSIEERNIEKIVSVLNAMSKKGEDLKGICLIHLKDDLAGKIDIEAFSKLGVIFNLGEFYSFYNEKIEKYPDDLSARYYLKRLLRGAAQLISAWKNLTLKNAEASKILDNQMSEALVANKENLIFFKKSLDELLVESIQEFTKTWLSSNPKPDDEQGLAINKVIQNVFQGFFFSENSQYKEITEKLIENRSRIVFSDYKAMALSQDLNGSLTDVLTQFVIEELLTQPKVFGVTSLGRYIVSKSPAIIVHSPDDYHETFKEKVLSAWRSDSFPLEAKKQLDDIIVKKIKTIELPENYRTFAEYRAVLDLLSQYKNREFANLEWEADLVKFIEDAIYGIIKKDMPSKLYSVTAVKEVDEVSMNSIQSLRENLTMKVTEQMLLDWRQGKLKGDINDELSSLALKDLKTVSDNISKLVYPIGVLISLKAQSKKTHELKDLLYQAFEKCKALFPDNPAFTQEIAALLSHPVFKDTLQVSGSGFFAQSAVQTDVTRSNPSLSTSSTPSLNN